jgi:hypothetical protein
MHQIIIGIHYCPVKEQRPLTSTLRHAQHRQAQHRYFDTSTCSAQASSAQVAVRKKKKDLFLTN